MINKMVARLPPIKPITMPVSRGENSMEGVCFGFINVQLGINSVNRPHN
jgi:hypothetical protein